MTTILINFNVRLMIRAAAAIAYGLDKKEGEKNIIVFSLGRWNF